MTLNANTPVVVLDASVAVKWLLTDEEDTAAAVGLLRRQREGRLRLLAPRQIEVEVANALRKAALAGRIATSEAGAGLDLWLTRAPASLHLVENRRLLRPALRESLRWGVSLFDALYVSLAVIAGTHLVTGDRRLLRAGSDLEPYLLDVRSFTP